MLAVQTVSNTNLTLYTVPTGKKAYVYVDIFAPASGDLSVMVNNKTYFSKQSFSGHISLKLSLTSADSIAVSFTDTCHVFIHGEEV